VKVTRIYTGKDEEAHFEELELAFESAAPGAHSASFPVERLFFRTFPPKHEVDYHVAPRRQWVMVVSGVMEVECKDGKRRFSPGEVLFLDDLTGRGHITRNIEGTRVLAYLPTPPGFDAEKLRGKP
jgi:quercetin dioxygenase-like cupin family protein